MKKIFISLLAALTLCIALSQFTFATAMDLNNQPTTEEQDEKSLQPPKNDDEEDEPSSCDCIDTPEEDGN